MYEGSRNHRKSKERKLTTKRKTLFKGCMCILWTNSAKLQSHIRRFWKSHYILWGPWDDCIRWRICRDNSFIFTWKWLMIQNKYWWNIILKAQAKRTKENSKGTVLIRNLQKYLLHQSLQENSSSPASKQQYH